MRSSLTWTKCHMPKGQCSVLKWGPIRESLIPTANPCPSGDNTNVGASQTCPVNLLTVSPGSIWKDGFNHGFHLEKVPLINCFVGRHEYITDMEVCLLPDLKPPRRKVYVVCGLGGMGKTQLAVDFARRHQTTFSSIFFIDGSSKDAVLQSFVRVFRRVAISDIDDTKSRSETDGVAISTPDRITAKALEWFSLERNNRWLLIYDNVDLEPTDPGGFALDAFFPARDCGSIIITTRLASLPVAATVKRLGELDTMQSIELLTGRSTAEGATNAWTYPGSKLEAQGKVSL